MQTIDFDTPRVVVALDHARYFGVVPGLQRPQPVLETVIEAGADAIMTSYGVIKHYRDVMQKIPTLMRLESPSCTGYRACRGALILSTAMSLGGS